MIKHYNIRVFGRVQGVLFRDSARRKARGLELTGFVRNENDGSVYLEAEGEEKALQNFLEWCSRGPLFAKVVKVESEESVEIRNYENFVIQ